MSGAIPCPACGATGSRVTDSRAGLNEAQKRYRKCACGHRFTTVEMPALALHAEVEAIAREVADEIVERIGSAVLRKLTQESPR